MQNLKKKLIVALLFIIGVFNFTPAYASIWQNINDPEQGGFEKVGTEVFGTDKPKSIAEIVAEVINIVFSFLGIIFIVLTVYAGFLWMTAGGESDKVETAKSILTNSVIGLAVTLSSYAISYFVINQLIKATGS